MKTLLILFAMVILAGCYSRRELQVEIISAQLVRIDTIHRYYPNEFKQQLTWRDDENVEYVSYAPIQAVYMVGTKMSVLKSR
jgi:hypothetical protein